MMICYRGGGCLFAEQAENRANAGGARSVMMMTTVVLGLWESDSTIWPPDHTPKQLCAIPEDIDCRYTLPQSPAPRLRLGAPG